MKRLSRPIALHFILFFGRGRGHGGRATAKPTVNRLDSQNGHRTGIALRGEMCYTWVSKLTNKAKLSR